MPKTKEINCKRPYDLGKRQELTGAKRATILAVARAQLESNGFLQLTMDALARESGVTRQTIHNMFGSKGALLEALFDQLALDGGMERMRDVMQQADPELMLSAFVEVFTRFWAKDRLLLKRIHGIAAIDPEFGQAVEARNHRRHMAASRIVDRLGRSGSGGGTQEKAQRVAVLTALTSFEFFDALVESCGSVGEASDSILLLAMKAMAPAT